MDAIHAKPVEFSRNSDSGETNWFKVVRFSALLRQVAARRELGLVGRLKTIVIFAIMFDVYNSIDRRRM